MQTDQMQLSILRAAQAVNTRIPACHVLRKSQQPIIVFSGSCEDVLYVLKRSSVEAPGKASDIAAILGRHKIG